MLAVEIEQQYATTYSSSVPSEGELGIAMVTALPDLLRAYNWRYMLYLLDAHSGLAQASALDLSQNGIATLEFQDSAHNSTMSPP